MADPAGTCNFRYPVIFFAIRSLLSLAARGRVQPDDPEGRRVGRIFEAQDGHADGSELEELLGELSDVNKAVRAHSVRDKV